jgi:hypothetical protein
VKPIVVKPDADTVLTENFAEGIATLRKVIHDEVKTEQRLREEADETSSRETFWHSMEESAKEQEVRVRELRKAERLLASLFLVEGSENKEGWLGIDKTQIKRASVGDPCPRVNECDGHLVKRRHLDNGNDLIVCDTCKAVVTKVQPVTVVNEHGELGEVSQDG